MSGSKNGTERYSNYFFFLCHQNILFSYLELMARRLVHEGGNDIIVYYQMDEVGPHQCKRTHHDRRRYNTSRLTLPISTETDPSIKRQRLLRVPGPLQTCQQRTRKIRSKLYTEIGKLWKTVIKSQNEIPNEVLARSYSMYHQILNTIIKHNCQRNFFYKGCVYFGCRQQFIGDGKGEDCIVFQSTTIQMIQTRCRQIKS